MRVLSVHVYAKIAHVDRRKSYPIFAFASTSDTEREWQQQKHSRSDRSTKLHLACL